MNNQLSEVVTVQNSIIPWSKAVEQGLNSLVPHQVIQTLFYQGLNYIWISTVAAHIKENGPVICELIQEVTILSQRLAVLPLAGPSQPVTTTPSPSSAMINRDILGLYNHLSKLQHEVKKAGFDLTFIYQEFGKVQHKVDGLQAEKAILSSWCQSQDKTNTDKISKLQEVLTNQDKRINLLEVELDVTCLENQAYTDKLDEHRALMVSIQDQLERENRKMASLEQNLDSLLNQHQHRETGHQFQGSYWNSYGQEEYHTLDSNKETNWRLPGSIQVLEVVTENGGPATVTIKDTAQDPKAQQDDAHKAVSKANRNRPASPIWQAVPATTMTHNTLPFFKPANLPRSDRKTNLAMFLWLYQNSMYGADEAMKDATIINCLDTDTQTLILPRLPENGWTYANISWALMEEFGSQEALLGQKMDFVDTKLKVGETLEEFTSRFYLEAQTLASMKAVLYIDVHSALLNAVQINRELLLALKSGIYTAQKVPDLIQLLRTYKENFEIPLPKGTPKPLTETRTRNFSTDGLKVVETNPGTLNNSAHLFFKCNKPGHLSQDCKSPHKILVVGGEPEEEDYTDDTDIE
ncbi:hypothetical protein DSO57_1006216 [Entomophthora muscae]|uniref:Uncharacterized protein n=1 Tax=Entomophthora muscae TaxID=34485 RepID=A0ACC2S9T7_9FUNG|nr:hypothetical protein DSO57_1006216 [Entomophthora muscae]